MLLKGTLEWKEVKRKYGFTDDDNEDDEIVIEEYKQ